MSSAVRRLGNTTLRYRREVRPLHFPVEEREDEKVTESTRHLTLRTALWQILKRAYAREHTMGSEQFIYWNAKNPRRCCSPDAWLKLGVPNAPVTSWKTWERGTPELVVEIVSPSDAERWTWEEKFERFEEMGVREVVRFDPDAAAGARLRVWDRIEDDLVEREVEDDAAPCLALGLFWVVAPIEGFPVGLRLARDRAGADLLPTPDEAERANARRVAELEAELRRRGG